MDTTRRARQPPHPRNFVISPPTAFFISDRHSSFSVSLKFTSTCRCCRWYILARDHFSFRALSILIANQGSAVPIQRQRESPFWGATRGETSFSENSSAVKQLGCGPAARPGGRTAAERPGWRGGPSGTAPAWETQSVWSLKGLVTQGRLTYREASTCPRSLIGPPGCK